MKIVLGLTEQGNDFSKNSHFYTAIKNEPTERIKETWTKAFVEYMHFTIT